MWLAESDKENQHENQRFAVPDRRCSPGKGASRTTKAQVSSCAMQAAAHVLTVSTAPTVRDRLPCARSQIQADFLLALRLKYLTEENKFQA